MDESLRNISNLTVRDLRCDPNTLTGPIDRRVVTKIERLYQPLDPTYLAYMEAYHGGRPEVCEFEADGRAMRFEMFLSLLDDESEVPPPFRPHFDHHTLDERVVNGMYFLTNSEHATSRALFGGLLPFATLQADMCLDRAYVDLLCFDYHDGRTKPAVVLWLADRAHTVSMEREDRPFSELFDAEGRMIGVPWENFLIPVADDFESFVAMLRLPMEVRAARGSREAFDRVLSKVPAVPPVPGDEK